MAFERPRAGDLKTRIELQNAASAASGTDGLTNSFPVVATVWARKRDLFGGRLVEGAQTSERATHVFTIRTRKDYVDGDEVWDTIECGRSGARRQFRVVSVMEQGDHDEWLEIMAEELRRGV